MQNIHFPVNLVFYMVNFQSILCPLFFSSFLHALLSFTFEFLISPLCLPSPLPPVFTATTTTKTCVLFPPLVSEAMSMSVRSGTWQSRTPLVRKDDSRGVRTPFKKPRQAQTHVSVESEASETETRKARQARRWGRSVERIELERIETVRVHRKDNAASFKEMERWMDKNLTGEGVQCKAIATKQADSDYDDDSLPIAQALSTTNNKDNL